MCARMLILHILFDQVHRLTVNLSDRENFIKPHWTQHTSARNKQSGCGETQFPMQFLLYTSIFTE